MAWAKSSRAWLVLVPYLIAWILWSQVQFSAYFSRSAYSDVPQIFMNDVLEEEGDDETIDIRPPSGPKGNCVSVRLRGITDHLSVVQAIPFAKLHSEFRIGLEFSERPWIVSDHWVSSCECDSETLNAEDASPLTGKLITYNGVEMYVVEPSSDVKGSIVVLQDIYSVRALTPSCRSGDRIGSICDALALAGYSVCLPRLFDQAYDIAVCGPEDGDFEKFDSFAQDGDVAWFQKQTYDKVGPIVQSANAYLKEQNHPGGLGVLGFCYGNWLLSKVSSTGDVKFDAAVGCHPATVLESAVFGGDEVDMMNCLKQPTKFLWAGNDSDIYVKDGLGKKALESSGGGVEEYPDMLHGWVSRGDMNDEKVQRDFKRAMDSIASFFEDQLQ